jgi:hypothetical protein
MSRERIGERVELGLIPISPPKPTTFALLPFLAIMFIKNETWPTQFGIHESSAVPDILHLLLHEAALSYP